MEEKFEIFDSESNSNFYNRNLFQTIEKNYPTNKTGVYHIVDIWRLDILDLRDYGNGNNRRYRYVLQSFLKTKILKR